MPALDQFKEAMRAVTEREQARLAELFATPVFTTRDLLAEVTRSIGQQDRFLGSAMVADWSRALELDYSSATESVRQALAGLGTMSIQESIGAFQPKLPEGILAAAQVAIAAANYQPEYFGAAAALQATMRVQAADWYQPHPPSDLPVYEPTPSPPRARAFLDLNAARSNPSSDALDRLGQHAGWRPSPEARAAIHDRAAWERCSPAQLAGEALRRGLLAALGSESKFSYEPPSDRVSPTQPADLIDRLSPNEYLAWLFKAAVHHAECWVLFNVCAVPWSHDTGRSRAVSAGSSSVSARTDAKVRKPRSNQLQYERAACGFWRACHRTRKSYPSHADVAQSIVPDVCEDTVRRAVLRFRAAGQAWPPPVEYDKQQA